ncbi:hypothetical protein L0664_18185 [Octadecabacter sp. G9-8]|uniref:Uncharacterized protein n=1 Tax=Octadecabacter dasysiphoniae TaxID=2909341 RepID=A0ABS9D0N2_9RHOB|nr:hypothetical protein [Octadecabacter dasysiphoniae]MCF2872998.1 hypothetical protein [Octadecabacter dasysiphoniae]
MNAQGNISLDNDTSGCADVLVNPDQGATIGYYIGGFRSGPRLLVIAG